jgi:hypothetical protein
MVEAIGYRHTLQNDPVALRQIIGRFNGNREIGCSGDVKTILPVLNAKVCSDCLNLGIPQHRWNVNIGKWNKSIGFKFTPTRSAWKIKGRSDVEGNVPSSGRLLANILESCIVNKWSVTLKKTFVNNEQPSNALSVMFVTLLGIITFGKL